MMMAELHLGRSNAIQAYQHTADLSVNSTCPKCGENQHIQEHWFTAWPAWSAIRQQLVVSTDSPLSTSSLFPPVLKSIMQPASVAQVTESQCAMNRNGLSEVR